jgi:3-oxoadipate enol-lactonase
LQINGRDYTIEHDGDGPAVLMIHGLGGTGTFYQPQVEALADRFRLIRPDLEGSGRTPLSSDAPLSISGWADDLQVLLDHLGVAEVRIVGHSMGTLIAQELAIRLGDRVLALLGAVKAPAEPGRKAQAERGEGPRRGDGCRRIGGRRERHVRNDPAGPSGAGRVHPRTAAAPAARGYARSCEALGSAAEPDTARVTAPLLLLTGTEDKVGPPAAAEELAGRVSQEATLRVYDAVGHWTAIEAPHEVATDLQKFL